jgi:hypothetical protein
MSSDLCAAIVGGVIGVAGAIMSAMVAYYFTSKEAERQRQYSSLEEQKKRDHERREKQNQELRNKYAEWLAVGTRAMFHLLDLRLNQDTHTTREDLVALHGWGVLLLEPDDQFVSAVRKAINDFHIAVKALQQANLAPEQQEEKTKEFLDQMYAVRLLLRGRYGVELFAEAKQ